jgi:hypothetical protein
MMRQLAGHLFMGAKTRPTVRPAQSKAVAKYFPRRPAVK